MTPRRYGFLSWQGSQDSEKRIGTLQALVNCFVNNIFNRRCVFFIFSQWWVVSGDCPCTPFSFSPHSSSFACAELGYFPFAVSGTHIASSAGCPPLCHSEHTGNTQLQFVWSMQGSGSGAGSLLELLLS